MTTPTRNSSNKTALRASLKKEDASLAERLVATDVPLVEPPEPDFNCELLEGADNQGRSYV
jgi:hypothetical protein